MTDPLCPQPDKESVPKTLKQRVDPKHLRSRLGKEAGALDKKMQLGYWLIRLRHQKYIYNTLKFIIVSLGLWQRGRKNTLRYVVNENRVVIQRLPEAFHNYRILHLSDLHIESMSDRGEGLLKLVETLKADLCVFTGDFRYKNYGDDGTAIRYMRKLLKRLPPGDGAVGVLGNHDSVGMVPLLEEAGLRVLLNESMPIVRQGQTLWLAGVDDPHYYKLHDFDKAFSRVPKGAARVLLAHSPEVATEAAEFDVDLYLCGHAHGGQICLPGEIPIVANMTCPRKYFRGAWTHHRMNGYTSKGAGASGLPVRFFSRPEVTIHHLVRP